MPWAALWGFPGAIHTCPTVPAASYLGGFESFLQTDNPMVLVEEDGAQDADAFAVRVTKAFQHFAVLGASPLSQSLPMARLHQHMVLLGIAAAVLVQVGLAQGGFTGQTRLDCRLGLLEAEITLHHLLWLARAFSFLLALISMCFLLSVLRSIHEFLHDVAELEVGLQLPSERLAQRAAGRTLLAPESLADAVPAETVAAAQGCGLPVNVQADGTGQLFPEPGHSLCPGHGNADPGQGCEGGFCWEMKLKEEVTMN